MLIDSELVLASTARAVRSRVTEHARALDSAAGRPMKAEQRSRRQAVVLAQSGGVETAGRAMERLLGGNDLVGVNYLELGVLCARSVCRLRLRDASGATIGFGTGFLVAPGVLMTNHHVISSAGEARHAVAEFDYERDVRGEDRPIAAFALQADPAPLAVKALDFCLVAVAGRAADGRALDEFGHLPLNETPGKAAVGEYLTIIQHPDGERKQVCVRENQLIRYDAAGDTVWYKTDTAGGSSGSPAFNGSWQVVALHHCGVPRTDAQGHWLTVDNRPWDQSMGESRVLWMANEGIRISSIIAYLRRSAADHPLAQAVLQHLDLRVTSLAAGAPVRAESAPPAQLRDGELRVTIPIQVALSIGGPGGLLSLGGVTAAAAAPGLPPPAAAGLGLGPRQNGGALPAGLERVDVNHADLDRRRGYDPEFLGHGLRVPLPVVKEKALAAQVLKFRDAGGRLTSELKYWNYSVVMNAARRLAFFSAVNVDPKQRPAGAGRDGDRWYFDPRIDQKYQLGPEFYSTQSEAESRAVNPFDRGHLTRRLDAQWGKGEEAKRAGDDSFHWSNCSPQHWKFNQGSKLWLGLEDYTVMGFAGGSSRACVINGCVFDAPRGRAANGGPALPVLDPQQRRPDPQFNGFAIPTAFFKVVAGVRDGALVAAAFLMSQEELLVGDERVRGLDEELTEAEAKLYQVPLAGLARLTGLDFGPLLAAERHLVPAEALHTVRRMERLEDVSLRRRALPPPPRAHRQLS